jgi:hypothetical protein
MMQTSEGFRTPRQRPAGQEGASRSQPPASPWRLPLPRWRGKKIDGNQGPGKTLRLSFIDQFSQTVNEFITILIAKKNLSRSIPLAMM